jgi:hypothetical protein
VPAVLRRRRFHASDDQRIVRRSAATARRASVVRISSGVSRASTIGHPQNLVRIASRRAGRGVAWHTHNPQRWRSRRSCFTWRTGLTRRPWLAERPWWPWWSWRSGITFRTRFALPASRETQSHKNDERSRKKVHSWSPFLHRLLTSRLQPRQHTSAMPQPVRLSAIASCPE